MTGTLLLALTLAQAAQPATVPASVQVGVLVTFADGAKTQLVSVYPRTRGVSYITSNASCAEPQVSNTAPLKSAFGWKVELGPAAGDTQVVWRRLEEAADTRGAKNGVRTLPTAADGEWTPLDRLDIPAAPGCRIQHWSLVARRTPPGGVNATRPTLMEAELWFVHRAPDGKETSTRQTLRLRGGTRTAAGSVGEFYFDDMVVNANVGDRTEPVTVEVFGSLMLFPASGDSDVSVGLQLTRRYVNPKAVALGIPPTVGKGNHHLTVQSGEVVSFVLPPVEGDKGHFLGHRFSVRLRLKPLGEGDD